MIHFLPEIWDKIASDLYIDDIRNLRMVCTLLYACFSIEEMKKLISQRSVMIDDDFYYRVCLVDFFQNRRIEYVKTCRINECTLHVLEQQHHIRYLHLIFNACERGLFGNRTFITYSKPNYWPELRNLHIEGRDNVVLQFPLQQLQKLEFTNVWFNLEHMKLFDFSELETLVLYKIPKLYNLKWKLFNAEHVMNYELAEQNLLIKTTKLKKVNLAHSIICDNAIRDLCKNQNLKVINVSGTNVTDVAFGNDDVACLQTVNITKCHNFTYVGVLRLIVAHAKTLRCIGIHHSLYDQTCVKYPSLFEYVYNIGIHICNHNEEVCDCTSGTYRYIPHEKIKMGCPI